MSAPAPIHLVVTDIDGCLTRGGRFPLDLALCQRLREWGEQSARDASVPALVFCTARPLPYVLALNQAIPTRLPSLVENGAVLWDPVSRRHALNPAAPADAIDHARVLHAEAERLFAHDDDVAIEEGKMAQVTLVPRRPGGVSIIEERARAFAARFGERLVVDRTHAVINLLPPGVNKGTGLLWLARETGIDPAQMAGIGDAASDWDFLQHCGLAAAPNDADAELLAKPAVWRCKGGPGDVVAEVMQAAIARNRASQ